MHTALPVFGFLATVVLAHLARWLFPKGVYPGGLMWIVLLLGSIVAAYWLFLRAMPECNIRRAESISFRQFVKERQASASGL